MPKPVGTLREPEAGLIQLRTRKADTKMLEPFLAPHMMKTLDSLPPGSHSLIVSRLKKNMNKPLPRIRPPRVYSQGELVSLTP